MDTCVFVGLCVCVCVCVCVCLLGCASVCLCLFLLCWFWCGWGCDGIVRPGHPPKKQKQSTHPHAVPDELLDGLKHVGGVAGGQGAVEEDDLALAILGDGAEGGEGQVEQILEGRLVCV